jgi:hypothetical protein
VLEVATRDMATPRGRCGVENCPSTIYRPGDTDGVEICENGHRHTSARAVAEQDDDDFSGAVSGKTTRRKKEAAVKVLKRTWFLFYV